MSKGRKQKKSKSEEDKGTKNENPSWVETG
jgi:hypothetical protein